jgi:hypothetical protein
MEKNIIIFVSKKISEFKEKRVNYRILDNESNIK